MKSKIIKHLYTLTIFRKYLPKTWNYLKIHEDKLKVVKKANGKIGLIGSIIVIGKILKNLKILKF